MATTQYLTAPDGNKILGISAVAINGVPCFRVIWRPRLSGEDALRRRRTTSERVATRTFQINDEVSEQEAFDKALAAARQAFGYDVAKSSSLPKVDWAALGATIHRTTLRRHTSDYDKAREMFNTGMSPTQVAGRMGISRPTASRWRKEQSQETA